jgi:hypothetical protein
LAGYLKQQ